MVVVNPWETAAIVSKDNNNTCISYNTYSSTSGNNNTLDHNSHMDHSSHMGKSQRHIHTTLTTCTPCTAHANTFSVVGNALPLNKLCELQLYCTLYVILYSMYRYCIVQCTLYVILYTVQHVPELYSVLCTHFRKKSLNSKKLQHVLELTKL